MASVSLQSQPCLPCMSRIQRAPSLPGHLEGVTDPQLRLGRSSNRQWCSSLGPGGRVCTPWDKLLTSARAARVAQSSTLPRELHTAKGAPASTPGEKGTYPLSCPILSPTFQGPVCSSHGKNKECFCLPGSRQWLWPDFCLTSFVFLANSFNTKYAIGFAQIPQWHRNISTLQWSTLFKPIVFMISEKQNFPIFRWIFNM